MARRIAQQRRRLLALPLPVLVETAGLFLRLPKHTPHRERVYTPWVTFWLFLAQVLTKPGSCSEAVSQAQPWFRLEKGHTLSSNTSAYCQARARLPVAYANQAFQRAVDYLKKWEREHGAGRRVCVVDGSSCSMPDTAQNQQRYPQPSSQTPGCGFPVMRFVGLFSLATGALLGIARGSLHDHERTLWRRLWDLLAPGDIALADRGFCAFADYALLLQRGVDSVMRLHGQRRSGVRKVKRLGKGDWLVHWCKASTLRPRWMEKALWNQLPNRLAVRHVKIAVRIPGFRTRSLIVATTLLDATAYPADALAELYRQRWGIELFLRDIKITMGMDVLRCKTPALVEKEFTMHLIAYNLVRALLLEAGTRFNRDITRLSLAVAVTAIRQWAPTFLHIRMRALRHAHLDAFLFAVASATVPHRPNRVEPRVRKRRPKNYQLLNKPRRLFRETPHRNRHQKTLS
jgi:hypothetical protein